MSGKARCWHCDRVVDRDDFWITVHGRMWCTYCHDDALSIMALIVNINAGQAVADVIAEKGDRHLANEAASFLGAVKT